MSKVMPCDTRNFNFKLKFEGIWYNVRVQVIFLSLLSQLGKLFFYLEVRMTIQTENDHFETENDYFPTN